jgi:dephospho-CoA kinase
MKRILLTGLSGTGKSTVIDELAARGYKAVDLDNEEYSEWVSYTPTSAIDIPVEPTRDWVWREDRVQELLLTDTSDVLFVSGCAVNMGKFLSQFDHVILLSAPAQVIVDRLINRTNNQYGKQPEEMERILSQIETVEPLLREASGHEIDTGADIQEVIARVLQITQLN